MASSRFEIVVVILISLAVQPWNARRVSMLVAKRLTETETIADGKQQLFEIVSMLMGLINSLKLRVHEEPGEYLSLEEQEQE